MAAPSALNAGWDGGFIAKHLSLIPHEIREVLEAHIEQCAQVAGDSAVVHRAQRTGIKGLARSDMFSLKHINSFRRQPDLLPPKRSLIPHKIRDVLEADIEKCAQIAGD